MNKIEADHDEDDLAQPAGERDTSRADQHRGRHAGIPADGQPAPPDPVDEP
jgi:hypothetical protein